MKLNEAVPNLAQDARFLIWVEQVKHSCSDFLSSLKGINYDHFLYRGVRSVGDKFGSNPIRQDRKTLTAFNRGTALGVELYNYFTNEAFHIPQIRSKCAFTSSALLHAKSFGYPVAIIPVDGSQYIYSSGVSDSISQRNNFLELLFNMVYNDYNEMFNLLYGDQIPTVVAHNDASILFKYLTDNPKLKQEVFQSAYQSYLDSDMDKIELSNGKHIMEIVNIEQNLEVLVYTPKFEYYYVDCAFMDKLHFVHADGTTQNDDIRHSFQWFFQRYFG